MKRRRNLGFRFGAFSVINCLAALARELEIEARSNCPACPTVSLWADGQLGRQGSWNYMFNLNLMRKGSVLTHDKYV